MALASYRLQVPAIVFPATHMPRPVRSPYSPLSSMPSACAAVVAW